MKALTFHGRQSIKYEDLPDPKILSPLDAIVRVEMCAICGSDMHPFHEREKGLDYGTAMGHEFVGQIVEIGKSVTRMAKGMRVFTPFTTSCGKCFYCQRGLTCRCAHGQLYGWIENGRGLHGGQAGYVRVPLADNTLLELPDSVAPEDGLLLGDVLSTGYFCAEMADIAPQGVYAVIGCGPVGLMTILSAIELRAQKLYAIDSIPERLDLATEFGATPINFKKESPVDVVAAATDGRGVDSVLEVVGSQSAAQSAFELVRPGGIISSVGVHTASHLAFSPSQAYDKNITYKTGRCPARYYMEKLLPLVRKKHWPLKSVITHRMALSEGPTAYEIFDLKKDGCIKPVLQPD